MAQTSAVKTAPALEAQCHFRCPLPLFLTSASSVFFRGFISQLLVPSKILKKKRLPVPFPIQYCSMVLTIHQSLSAAMLPLPAPFIEKIRSLCNHSPTFPFLPASGASHGYFSHCNRDLLSNLLRLACGVCGNKI